MKEHTDKWERNIHTISKAAGKYSQEIYAMLVHAIQLGGFFYNASQRIWETNLQECRRCFRKLFASAFLWKVKISLTDCRDSMYDAIKEIWPGPTRSHDVREREVSKFATLNAQAHS